MQSCSGVATRLRLVISPSTCWESRESVQTRPTGSPVSAASGLVAELKMTFVHCEPPGILERVRAAP